MGTTTTVDKDNKTVDHGEIPFGPTEDSDKSTKDRHKINMDLVGKNEAVLKVIKAKYNDPDTGRSHQASATVVAYKSLEAIVKAWGAEDALKLANQGAELRQRSSISAVLRAKAQGPEKAAASGIKSLAKAGFDVNDLLLALQALDPEKAEMLKNALASKDSE